MKRVFAVVVVLLLVAGGVVYFLWPRSSGSNQGAATPSGSINQRDTVTIYHPTYKNDQIGFEKNPIKVADGNPIATAINGMLREPKLFPAGVQLLDSKVEGDTVTLDFSKELRAGYSTDEEEAVLKSISTSMGQFKELNKVRIFVEGKPIDTLGNIDLSEPMEVERQ